MDITEWVESLPPVTQEELDQTVEEIRAELQSVVGGIPILRVYTIEQLDYLSWYFGRMWPSRPNRPGRPMKVERLERAVNRMLKARREPDIGFYRAFSMVENRLACRFVHPIKTSIMHRGLYDEWDPTSIQRLGEAVRGIVDIATDGYYRGCLRASQPRLQGGKYQAALLIIATPCCVIMFARPRRFVVDSSSRAVGCFKLHCEDGPAFISADGEEGYYLHGERVPKRVITDPENVSRKDLLRLAAIPYVDVRAAILSRLPFHTILRACKAREMDTWQGYKLYRTSKRLKANCLLMRNPTTGMMHLEWVPKTCQTVEEALSFRNRKSGLPIILT